MARHNIQNLKLSVDLKTFPCVAQTFQFFRYASVRQVFLEVVWIVNDLTDNGL